MQQLETYIESKCPKDQLACMRILKRVGTTKRILKREKAKQRNISKRFVEDTHKEESTIGSNDEDKLIELKKRNRISAQISRDRRKLYVQHI